MISALSQHAEVRAFVRDPNQASALEALGAADVAVGDMGDRDSLQQALTGAPQILHIGPAMDPNEVEYTNNAIEAAKKVGVEQFIYYSVMHPQRRDVRHHRLKLEAEEDLIESGLPYTILEPIRYMQHLDPIWSRVVDEGIHAMPFSVDRKFNVVDLADLAAATTRVILEPDHLYATYELAGPQALSQRDMAAILSKVIGREVNAE
ncbi:MAG: NmrA family NAD(P)-binding protein, partial [Gammaproteobacteria bacterium]